jgi:hypothetical protein
LSGNAGVVACYCAQQDVHVQGWVSVKTLENAYLGRNEPAIVGHDMVGMTELLLRYSHEESQGPH